MPINTRGYTTNFGALLLLACAADPLPPQGPFEGPCTLEDDNCTGASSCSEFHASISNDTTVASLCVPECSQAQPQAEVPQRFEDNDCPAPPAGFTGKVWCRESRCELRCSDSSGCPSGYACSGSQCVVPGDNFVPEGSGTGGSGGGGGSSSSGDEPVPISQFLATPGFGAALDEARAASSIGCTFPSTVSDGPDLAGQWTTSACEIVHSETGAKVGEMCSQPLNIIEIGEGRFTYTYRVQAEADGVGSTGASDEGVTLWVLNHAEGGDCVLNSLGVLELFGVTSSSPKPRAGVPLCIFTFIRDTNGGLDCPTEGWWLSEGVINEN